MAVQMQGAWHETCLSYGTQSSEPLEPATTTPMIALTSLLLALGTATTTAHVLAPVDTTPPSARPLAAEAADSTAADSVVSRAVAPASVLLVPPSLSERLASEDTVHKRRKAVVLNDAALLRLRIHRYASYTVIPLFVLQSVAGNQLLQADNGGVERPGWAQSAHSFGAAAIGTVFAINTITGVWGLYDERANDQGRTLRWAHSILMLASDAGFTYTGIKLADEAKRSPSDRNNHKNLAYASIGTALVGYGIMYFGNR